MLSICHSLKGIKYDILKEFCQRSKIRKLKQCQPLFVQPNSFLLSAKSITCQPTEKVLCIFQRHNRTNQLLTSVNAFNWSFLLFLNYLLNFVRCLKFDRCDINLVNLNQCHIGKRRRIVILKRKIKNNISQWLQKVNWKIVESSEKHINYYN